ncbi:MAG: hypothetical protein CM1200mP30_18890 [Pseudomonadota bacterium]|nr:MAG: hypothetical protein CM1200mP30_18890 [Pseudomonadota bacterium]
MPLGLIRNERHTVFGFPTESTGGSVYNIKPHPCGKTRYGCSPGLTGSIFPYRGTSKFKDQGPFKGLRAIFSVHPEPVTILARRDSGIRQINDLKGKRLNIGNPGSGTRATWEVIEEALGWSPSDLKLGAELRSAEKWTSTLR